MPIMFSECAAAAAAAVAAAALAPQAQVVYFAEYHLECRRSNRRDLKEQWSNHKGPSPQG